MIRGRGGGRWLLESRTSNPRLFGRDIQETKAKAKSAAVIAPAVATAA